jgi:AraC-like DNA-binding protein
MSSWVVGESYPCTGAAEVGMGMIDAYTTDGLNPRQRRHFWSEITSRVFTPMDAQPRSPKEFSAHLRRVALGNLSLVRAISAPAVITHGAAGIRQSSEQVFLLHLQVQGSSINRQDGREALLLAGDFALCDSTRPYTVQFDDPNDMLVLRIAAPLLRDRLVQPESFTAQRVIGSAGVGGLVSRLLQQLWSECEVGLEPRVIDRLGSNFLDLFVTALSAQRAQSVQDGTVMSAKRLQVRYFIEERLTDPELDASVIAAAVRISSRYVHRLFELDGETLGQYVFRRRMEESARRLKDPAHAARSVKEIAFDCGFTDASYFGRCFRNKFGMTPREFRLQKS